MLVDEGLWRKTFGAVQAILVNPPPGVGPHQPHPGVLVYDSSLDI